MFTWEGGAHEHRALGRAGTARAGVFRPRLALSVPPGCGRRTDERVVAALVPAVSRRRGSAGGSGTHTSWSDANHAVAGDGRGGRDHDRDRIGNRVSSGAGRDELRGHHAAAVGDGHVRRVHAASGAAHRRPPRGVGTKCGPGAPVAPALHTCGAVVSLPIAMVAPLVDPDSLPSIRPDGVPAIDIESSAFDRPLRIGVLLDGLTVPRWVAKILQDIMAAPFLTLSLVIVDATDPDAPAATWS